MVIEKALYASFWTVTFGPIKPPNTRSDIRAWARKNCKNKFTVDVTCFPGITNEFWTFDDYQDAFLFSLKWSDL